MRRDVKLTLFMTAIAATLAIGIPSAQAGNADVKACDALKEADARMDCYTLIVDDESVSAEIHSHALSRRSGGYAGKGDLVSAIDDAAMAIELNPKNRDGYFARAYAYQLKGNADLAIADYTKAIEINPRDADALINRANAWTNKGEYDRAIQADDEILAMHAAKTMLSPIGVMYTYNNRGVAHLNKREYELALADFDQAIATDAKFTTAYFNRGRVHNTKGEADAAIVEFTKAIELSPAYVIAYLDRAAAYRTKGDYDAAIADYLKVMEINPGNQTAAQELGKTYVESTKAAVVRLWKRVVGG